MTITVETNQDDNSPMLLGERKLAAAMTIMVETNHDDKEKKRAAGKTAKKCGMKDDPIKMPQPAMTIMAKTNHDDKEKKRATGKMAIRKQGMKDDPIKMLQSSLLSEQKRAKKAKKGAMINETTTMMAENKMNDNCNLIGEETEAAHPMVMEVINLNLTPCVMCKMLVMSDCKCQVCAGSLHCFCSIIEGEGHGAHYMCSNCNMEHKQKQPDINNNSQGEQKQPQFTNNSQGEVEMEELALLVMDVNANDMVDSFERFCNHDNYEVGDIQGRSEFSLL